MNAILNILVIVFVLAMAYWWSIQGAFSALLHLVVVIVAGTLAFALWETFAVGPANLVAVNAHYAWTVALLLPFGLLLIILRVATDKLIPRNVSLPNMLNSLLGGVFGFGAGVLIAGITIVGMGFLPMPAALMGYQRYALPPHGQVVPAEQGLWMNVDDWTTSFFYRLSAGSFSTGTPLAEYQPDLADRASLIRVRDDNISVAMQPKSIQVLDLFTENTPLKTADDTIKGENGKLYDLLKPGQTVVVVDTKLTKGTGVGDGDGLMRLAPTQVLLTTQPSSDADDGGDSYAAVGYVEDNGDGQRIFHPLQGRDSKDFADTVQQEIEWGWVFIIPATEQPHLLWVRAQRLSLVGIEPNNAPDAFRVALGTAKAVESDIEPPTDDDLGDREGAVVGLVGEHLEITNMLPRAFSMNQAPGSLTVRSQELVSGRGDIPATSGRISNATRVDTLQTTPGTRMLRLHITPDLAKSFYGRVRQQAAQLNPPYLVDDRGNNWYAIGYVWQRAGDIMEVRIDRDQLLRTSGSLPLAEVEREGGSMYLYFNVQPGVRITKFMFGGNTFQELSLPVPAE